MKHFFTAALFLLSFSAFAQITELVCVGKINGKDFNFVVDQQFPSGNDTKYARLTVTEEDYTETVFDYTITKRQNWGYQKIYYTGASVHLEINTSPDTTPRWFKTYHATINIPDLSSKKVFFLCQFHHI